MTDRQRHDPALRSFAEPDEPLPPLALAGPTTHRMGLNENPYGPTEAVQQAILRSCRDGHRYPSMDNVELTALLASRREVPAEMVVAGPGLVALCRGLVHATAGPGDEVVLPWPSFDDYLVDALLHEAVPVRSPLREHRLDLDDIADRVGPGTRLVFLCNPNNPTGTAFTQEALERFLDAVPPQVTVVLDEAYHEFGTAPDLADGLRALPERGNLCVLRTFSKAYGLAGLRVAYAVAHPVVSAALRNVMLPFGLSRVAEAAAVAALHDEPEITRRVRRIVSERESMTARLHTAGWPVVPSQGNFVWLALERHAAAVALRLAAAGIAVRAYPGHGIRITATTSPDTERLLHVLEEISLYQHEEGVPCRT